jgi:hypothetical protein
LNPEIPPRESDYRPLRITRDQLRIGDVAWTIRNRRRGPGILRAECRHDASGDAWGDLTVTLAPGADGYSGRLTIDGAPWLVRGWRAGPAGVEAEAGPVSDAEFEHAAEMLTRVIRSG